MLKNKARVTGILVAVLSVVLLTFGFYDQSLANKKYREELAAHNQKVIEGEKVYSEVSTNTDAKRSKIKELLARREAQIDDLARSAKKTAHDKVSLSLVYDCKRTVPQYCLKIVNRSDFNISSISGEITTYSGGNEWKTFRAAKSFGYYSQVRDEYDLEMGYVVAPIGRNKRATREGKLFAGFVSYNEAMIGSEERARAAAGTLRIKKIELTSQQRIVLDSDVTLKGEILFSDDPIPSDEGGSRTYFSPPINFRDIAAQQLENNEKDKLHLVEIYQDLEPLEDELENRQNALDELKEQRPKRGGIFSGFYGYD